nr:hypothetical protein [Tanacetum cinerariifolium]
MNEFCEMKGIRRKFSVARTPQQNGVAERKNRNQTNGNSGTKANIDARRARKKTVLGPQYVLLPLLTSDSQGSKSSKVEAADDAGKKVLKFQEKRMEFRIQQKKEAANTNSTNRLNTVSSPDNAIISSFTIVDPGGERAQRNELESMFGQDKDANGNSTYRMFTPVSAAGSSYDILDISIPINVATLPNADLPTDPLMPVEDIADLQDTGILVKVCRLIDLPKGKHAIGTKWVYRNKKDKRGIVVRNKARLVAQGQPKKKELIMMRCLLLLLGLKQSDPQFPDKVYKVEKALYGLNQAPRAWYETLSTYLLKNRFRRGIIDKTFFIKKEKCDILLVQVYIDDIIFGSTKKSLCTEFEGLMHKKFQMSSMIKTTSTLIETNKALLNDEEAEDVDVHLYRSMIGSLMYLTASRRDIMIFGYLKGQTKLGLWYPKDSPFDLEAFLDSDYAGASLDRNPQQEVLWIQNQMLDYGFNFMNTKIYIDNEKTIWIVKNPVYYLKTKHIKIRHHFIRDYYEKRLIQVIKIHTDHNVADLLTKAFDVSSDVFGVKTGSSKVSAAMQKTYGNAEFHPIVDFLTTSPFHYALTQIHAIVDGKTIVLLESSVRSDLHFIDEDGSGPRCQDTTFGNADAQTRRSHTGSDEGRPNITELVAICTQLSNRVLSLEQSKTAQDLVIKKLQKKVKRLEKKQRERTLGMNLFKIGTFRRQSLDNVNVSKQGRNLKTRQMFEECDIDENRDDNDYMVDEAMENVKGDTVNAAGAVNTTTTRVSAASASVTTAGVSISISKPKTPPITITTVFEDEDLINAQTLVKMRSEKAKEKGVSFRDADESARPKKILPTINPKDKGKAFCKGLKSLQRIQEWFRFNWMKSWLRGCMKKKCLN